jgi:hypothetical protein
MNTEAGKKLCVVKSFKSFILIFKYQDNQMKAEIGGALAHMGKMINAYTILVGSPEEETRPSHGWEDNRSIKIDQGSRVGGCRLD